MFLLKNGLGVRKTACIGTFVVPDNEKTYRTIPTYKMPNKQVQVQIIHNEKLNFQVQQSLGVEDVMIECFPKI